MELKLQFFADDPNESDNPHTVVKDGKVPTTGQDNSEVANRNGWLLFRRAKYNPDSSEMKQDIMDFKMLPFYHSLKTVDNAQLDTTQRAASRTESSVAVAYQSHIEFTFRHHTLGPAAKEIMPIVQNRWTGNKANVEIVLIYDIADTGNASNHYDKKWDNAADFGTGRWVGNSLRAIRYFGPMTFDNSHFSGEDTKIVDIKAKLSTKSDPIDFILAAGGSMTQDKLDRLVEDFALINHPLDLGHWVNNNN